MEVSQRETCVQMSHNCLKSPNILVYSEDETGKGNLEIALRKLLDQDRYSITKVSKETLESGAWRGKVSLVVITGKVGSSASILSEYFLEGGRILDLSSDCIYTILPYIEKKNVSEEQIVIIENKVVPRDHFDFIRKDSSEENNAEQDVKVIYEDSFFSVLKYTSLTNNGTVIFCQKPLNIEIKSDNHPVIEDECEDNPLEILSTILKDTFKLHVRQQASTIEYTMGYFIGDNDEKLKHIRTWCCDSRRMQKLPNILIQWCHKGEQPTELPSASFLPIILNDHPKNFSTEEYFNNLKTTHLGRLIVYADVMSSTMEISDHSFVHGFGAIARRQLAGRGRGGNAWISPPGQASMSLQVWQKISPSLPLVQHAAALAIVLAIRKEPYQHLNIRIKWPNDIYYGRNVKIGGVVTTANCTGDDVVINIGAGVNICNSVPTVCVNDIILDHNRENETGMPLITIESFLGRYCSELEKVLDSLSKPNGVDKFLELYYKYWLHSDEEIKLKMKDDSGPLSGSIVGVDAAGWLVVRTSHGDVTVAPDGNTFDIMSGLIAPK